MKKVLIIDNYDSFTYILKQYFGELGGNPEVFFHDKITVSQIKKMKPTHIVLSPGPGTVDRLKDVGVMFDVIKEFYKKIPILGVCLGHQAIGKFFGGEIVRAPKIIHGKRSVINFDNVGIFRGIKKPFSAMRYHSLLVQKSQIMNHKLTVVAKTKDNLIMAVQHKEYPVFGVQFHPESLGTDYGKRLLKNFLNCEDDYPLLQNI